MLALLEPGDTPVPWMDNLRSLGPMDELTNTSETTNHFPVKASSHRPSYSSSPVVWIKHASLHSDIQVSIRNGVWKWQEYCENNTLRNLLEFDVGLNTYWKIVLFQKILRHARKLPEKSLHFYKELNRLKRAALYIGFYELLEGCAAIFDRGKNQTDLRYRDNENYECARCQILTWNVYGIFQSVRCFHLDLKEEYLILTVQFSSVMLHQS